MLEQHTARRENMLCPMSSCTRSFIASVSSFPDDLRHLHEQPPKPLIRLRQLRVFRFQLVLLPDQLRNVCGSDLRIADARFLL